VFWPSVRPSRDRLQQHVDHWSARLKEVPSFVYHFAHLENAAGILNQGEILSRSECIRLGLNPYDSASPSVIAKTPQSKQRFVRLYFRPRTPTQWHCEGIRPVAGIAGHNAHCPIPVFFLYDFVDLLSRDTTQFSDGNMASPGVRYGDSVEFFDSIPFENVYHTGYVSAAPDPSSVVFNRCAEVLVPDRLSTDALRAIVCRSHAERRTLLHKLAPETRSRWSPRMKVAGGGFFDRDWAFVEQVTGSPGKITFKLHHPSQALPLDLDFTCLGQGQSWRWSGSSIDRDLTFEVPGAEYRGHVVLRIFEHEAFAAEVTLDDSPF